MPGKYAEIKTRSFSSLGSGKKPSPKPESKKPKEGFIKIQHIKIGIYFDTYFF